MQHINRFWGKRNRIYRKRCQWWHQHRWRTELKLPCSCTIQRYTGPLKFEIVNNKIYLLRIGARIIEIKRSKANSEESKIALQTGHNEIPQYQLLNPFKKTRKSVCINFLRPPHRLIHGKGADPWFFLHVGRSNSWHGLNTHFFVTTSKFAVEKPNIYCKSSPQNVRCQENVVQFTRIAMKQGTSAYGAITGNGALFLQERPIFKNSIFLGDFRFSNTHWAQNLRCQFGLKLRVSHRQQRNPARKITWPCGHFRVTFWQGPYFFVDGGFWRHFWRWTSKQEMGISDRCCSLRRVCVITFHFGGLIF